MPGSLAHISRRQTNNSIPSKGVFLSNADSSIVFTTHALIASEFDDLSNSSWIFVSFGLAATAAQPLVRMNSSEGGIPRADAIPDWEALGLIRPKVCAAKHLCVVYHWLVSSGSPKQ